MEGRLLQAAGYRQETTDAHVVALHFDAILHRQQACSCVPADLDKQRPQQATRHEQAAALTSAVLIRLWHEHAHGTAAAMVQKHLGQPTLSRQHLRGTAADHAAIQLA